MFRPNLALELVNLCALAYGDAPAVGGFTLRGSALLLGETKTFSRKDWQADTEGFTSLSEGGDVVVAFRGSESKIFTPEGALTDWVMTDFASARVPYSPAPGSWPNRRWVHRGFLHAYELVGPVVVREVQRLLDRSHAAEPRIFVTGHSLGGALAFLCALELADAFREMPVELYSFGAPRVGDGGLNKLLAERVADSCVVGYRGDPIIHVPPIGPNFPVVFTSRVKVHIGPVTVPLSAPLNVTVGQQYQTADRIVYINRRGEVKDRLPVGMVTLRFNDHLIDRYVSEIGKLVPPATGTQTAGTPARRRSGGGRAPVWHTMLTGS